MAALRSGEYEQTANQLGKEHDGVKCYCCEGVAVERYAKPLGYSARWEGRDLFLIDKNDPDDLISSDYAEDDFWEDMGLSTGVDNGTSTAFAFILPEGNEVRDTGASAVSFMALNDEGLTFAQIADLIEWQYLSRVE